MLQKIQQSFTVKQGDYVVIKRGIRLAKTHSWHFINQLIEVLHFINQVFEVFFYIQQFLEVVLNQVFDVFFLSPSINLNSLLNN